MSEWIINTLIIMIMLVMCYHIGYWSTYGYELVEAKIRSFGKRDGTRES